MISNPCNNTSQIKQRGIIDYVRFLKYTRSSALENDKRKNKQLQKPNK